MRSLDKPINILIADDHLIFRLGMRTLLSTDPCYSIVGEASTAEEAIVEYNRLKPNIMLLDLRMPQAGGLAVVKEVMRQDACARILIVTSYEIEEEIFQIMQAGAAGYLLKDADHTTMLNAIQKVVNGDSWMPKRIESLLAERITRKNLTPRELEIVYLLVRGLTNNEIGSVLRISESTVKNHMYSLFDKLHVADRTEAVAFCLSRGIVKADEM